MTNSSPFHSYHSFIHAQVFRWNHVAMRVHPVFQRWCWSTGRGVAAYCPFVPQYSHCCYRNRGGLPGWWREGPDQLLSAVSSAVGRVFKSKWHKSTVVLWKIKVWWHKGFSHLQTRLIGRRRMIKPKHSSLQPLGLLPGPRFSGADLLYWRTWFWSKWSGFSQVTFQMLFWNNWIKAHLGNCEYNQLPKMALMWAETIALVSRIMEGLDKNLAS